MDDQKPGMMTPEVARDRAAGAGLVCSVAGVAGLIGWLISGNGWPSAVIAGGLFGLLMLLAATAHSGHR